MENRLFFTCIYDGKSLSAHIKIATLTVPCWPTSRARLKDKRKSIKETERRAREAASKLGDHAPSISCGRLGSMSGESSFTLPAARDGPDHRSTERGPAGDAASGDREHGDGARAKSGASVGGSNNKEVSTHFRGSVFFVCVFASPSVAFPVGSAMLV